MSQLFRRSDRAQLDHQRLFIPLNPARLVVPVFACGRELHVKGPQHTRNNEAHFKVRKTYQRELGAYSSRTVPAPALPLHPWY